jgi:Tfp pilus assembly protein PilP
MKTQLYLAFVSMLLLSAACSSSQQEGSNSNYADEIRQWHQERIESLKKEDGWLNLTYRTVLVA